MDKFIINGPSTLNGSVNINGAKNAVLPIMAATLITPGEFSLQNVPDLRDTRTMIKLLETIGAAVEFNDHHLRINTDACDSPIAPYDQVKTMRASFDVLGPLLSRFGWAKVSLPGGCAWGPRPVDLHLKALEALGVSVTLDGGYIIAEGEVKGGEFRFPISSVGATKNAIMAAVGGTGTTVLHNAACEPEVVETARFLNELGARISELGGTTLTIEGNRDHLATSLEFEVIPDRIEAGTFLIAAALTGGSVELANVKPDHLQIVIKKLQQAGQDVSVYQNSLRVSGQHPIEPVDIETAPYPGFPTDLQAQWMALMICSSGQSIIKEGIYSDRFNHVPELIRLGGKVSMNNNIAHIKGIDHLTGAPVMSTDIRASASLVLAGLAAEGETEISRVYHIDRGYQLIEERFQKLGANIKRVSD